MSLIGFSSDHRFYYFFQESNNECFEESLLNGLKEVIQRQCQKRKDEEGRSFEDCFATVLFLTQLLEEVRVVIFFTTPQNKVTLALRCPTSDIWYDMAINIWCTSRWGYQNWRRETKYYNLNGRSEASRNLYRVFQRTILLNLQRAI